MNLWTKNSSCQKLERCDFVKEEEMLQVDEMKPHNSIEEEMMLEEGRRRRRSKRAARKQKRQSKRAARKQKRQSKRAARKQRRAAKKAKRKQKRAAKKAKRKAKKAAKCAKKPRCLRRKAKFQLKVLPKIVLMLKPSLLSAMSQMDMGDGAEGGFRACKADGEKECVPVDKIGVPDLLLNF